MHDEPQNVSSVDREHELSDDEDDAALDRSATTGASLMVVYDIIHSPSYQVPVLYITFKQHPPDGLRMGSFPPPEEMYELLVPLSHRRQVQAVGVMGALSMTDHPVSGTPAYFVHPCLTAEAMSAVAGGRQFRPVEYLSMWLGLVGPNVGLNVPVDVVTAISQPE